jgi:hypothetical protein
MTPPRSLVVMALAALAAAGCDGCTKPPPAPVEAARGLAAVVATCAGVVGAVEVRRAGQPGWEPVAPGSVFREGDEVRTAALASARIEFVAGGAIELEELAAVIIDTAPREPATAPRAAEPLGGTRLSVKEGVVRGFLPELAASTVTGQAGLLVAVGGGAAVRLGPQPRGSAAYRLTRRENGTEIAVTAGSAVVTGAAGARVLAAGQLALAAAAGAADPADLIAFPQSVDPGIDARVQLVPDLRVRLTWRPVAGATGYRVQVARDLSFQHLVASARVDAAEMTFSPGDAGVFAWRVASFDAEGRQGEFGFARRLFCEERPAVDLLVGPADGAVVRFLGPVPRVTFTWRSSGEARSYRVVLAKDPDLLDRAQTGVVAGQRAELQLLEPGEYWWGVYESGPTPGDRPIHTRPRRLQVVRAAKLRVAIPESITRWGD